MFYRTWAFFMIIASKVAGDFQVLFVAYAYVFVAETTAKRQSYRYWTLRIAWRLSRNHGSGIMPTGGNLGGGGQRGTVPPPENLRCRCLYPLQYFVNIIINLHTFYTVWRRREAEHNDATCRFTISFYAACLQSFLNSDCHNLRLFVRSGVRWLDESEYDVNNNII